MQSSTPPSNIFEFCICWGLWLFGTLLEEIHPSILLSKLTTGSVFLFDLSKFGDVLFQVLQNTSFIIAIVVGVVSLGKTFGWIKDSDKRKKK